MQKHLAPCLAPIATIASVYSVQVDLVAAWAMSEAVATVAAKSNEVIFAIARKPTIRAKTRVYTTAPLVMSSARVTDWGIPERPNNSIIAVVVVSPTLPAPPFRLCNDRCA